MRIGAIVALALTGCATASGPSPRQASNQWALANATPVGAPENCVDTSRIRSMRSRDDRTIDFELHGGRILRNRLPHACPGLAFEDRFAYRTTIGRLCAIDTVTVLRPDGSQGPTCGLGPFQRIEIAPRR